MPLDEKQIRSLLKNQQDYKVLTAKHRSLLKLGETYTKNIGELKDKLTLLIDERDMLIVECVHEEISYTDIASNFGVSRQRVQQVTRSIDLAKRFFERES